jgi:hypothetical protein
VIGSPANSRCPAEKVVRRAHIRYITAVPTLDAWDAMTEEQRMDRRDWAWTARDAFGAALDEWDTERHLPARRYWWSTYDGQWPLHRSTRP